MFFPLAPCLGQNGIFRACPPRKISETIRIFSESVSFATPLTALVQFTCYTRALDLITGFSRNDYDE